jgi:hypothetical protein
MPIASNTYVLHSCSDPFPVAKRAGKRQILDTSWSEEETGTRSAQRHMHSRWEWKVPENAVMQQTEGQAYWINRGRAQQVLTARVPLSAKQVRDAWELIREAEEAQQSVLQQRLQGKQPGGGQGQQASPPDKLP